MITVKRLVFVLLVSSPVFAQQAIISRPALEFTYTSPPGWAAIITYENPGQEVDFNVKSGIYPWSFVINVNKAATIPQAAADAAVRQWRLFKFYRQFGPVTLSTLSDSIYGDGHASYSAVSFYPDSTRQFYFLHISGSFHTCVHSSFVTGQTNGLLVDIDEITKVGDGLVFASAVTTKRAAPAAVSPLKAKILDALGRLGKPSSGSPKYLAPLR